MNVLRAATDELQVELLPELGGRLHRLRAFGHDLLRTPDEVDEYRHEPFFWGGFVMAPWCNRVVAGPQVAAGRRVDLAPNFSDRTAIHGQVQALPWDTVGPGMLLVRAGGDGWPWPYEVAQRFELDGPRLRLALELANRADTPMPAGIGFHPWFVQPLEIQLAAEVAFTSNHESSARPVPVTGPYDLRRHREMPPDLDATWVRSAREPISLRWPTLGVAATMEVSADGRFVCAASPSRFGSVAVEPQTHAPNGLRRLVEDQPGALQLLEPGGALHLEVELTFASGRPLDA